MQEFFTGIPEFEAYQEIGTEGNLELEKGEVELPGFKLDKKDSQKCLPVYYFNEYHFRKG